MNASEITQAGHYWYRGLDDDWDVVLFDGRGLDQIGAMCSLPISEFPGEFVGPLLPPSDEPALCDCPCHTDEPGAITLHMMPCCDRSNERFNPAASPPTSPPETAPATTTSATGPE